MFCQVICGKEYCNNFHVACVLFAGFAPYPFQHSQYSRMTSSYFMKTMFIVKLGAIVSVSGVLVVAAIVAILAVRKKKLI